jgi:hypothetical protein
MSKRKGGLFCKEIEPHKDQAGLFVAICIQKKASNNPNDKGQTT